MSESQLQALFPPISAENVTPTTSSDFISTGIYQTPRRKTVAINDFNTNPYQTTSISNRNTPVDFSLKIKLDVQYTPINSELGEWWDEHAHYTKISRQGIDIICVIFEQKLKKKAIANIIILNGWSDSFLRYAEIVKTLCEKGFNVQMFDYQSHGLSGRWLNESQSLWVNSFDDHVDDFVYFTTLVNKDYPNLPLYVIGHCLGGSYRIVSRRIILNETLIT